MAFKKNETKETKETKERAYLNIEGMVVSRARTIADNCISFALSGNGLSLYNLKLIDGKNGMFITNPSTKGDEGKYYDQYRIWLSDEDEKKLIQAVIDQVNGR